MLFSSLEVALEATPELAHEHPDFATWTEREIQSAMRDATKIGAERRRCGGCNAWVTNGAELHSCGFDNDIRNGRN